jgi:enhanced entry protein EnhC
MDMQKAETLFVKAKDAGFVPAMTALAKLYLQSSSNTSKEEAVQWYKKAASLGDREAMYYLGLLQETGVGMHLNKQDALQNYQLAAERGHEKAILALARMYRYGLGVNKDLSLAAKYYKQLAKNNNGYAQYQLALLYADGSILIEKPEETAKALLMAASRNGSREAQERLTWSNAKQEKNKSFIAAIPMKRSATNKPSSAERMYLEVVNGWNHGDEASSKSMLEALRTHYPDFIPAKEAYERMEQHAKAQML